MKRVYVAGAYASDNILGMLGNMRNGMRTATEVLLCGFAPFVPWFDYHFQLMLREENHEKLELKDYYEYSLAWLEVSNMLLVVSGWENSVGTQGEIKRATELNIPIYYSLEELMKNEGK